jgi:hypothetical protein
MNIKITAALRKWILCLSIRFARTNNYNAKNGEVKRKIQTYAKFIVWQ